ncbi:hypothetical protein ACT3TZ_02645 [Brachybacterium sp. AOP25-B2-12]|uniref:hypothetical protein n=1 Tax=Brachybacterium sp. AOP25-B2-12 TaxID=3457710 RepID=UPI0040340C40
MTARSTLLALARQAKHRAFLAWKFRHLHLRHVEFLREARQRRQDLSLPPELVAESFLRHDEPGDPGAATAPIPRVLWVLWTGENPMSPTRTASLAHLREVQRGLEVRLVTPATIDRWILPDHPLHPRFEDLTLVHRSDYLRAYLLHHHGGAYTDVKRPIGAWLPVLEQVERQGIWLAGYPEIVHTLIPRPEPFGDALRDRSSLLTGQGAFICRARTSLTAEWMHEVDARLDAHAEALRRTPGDTYGERPGYALRWTELLAEVTEPLEIKHRAHVLRDRRLLVRTRGYR